VACVRDQYSRFDLNVVDQDPGEAAHFEAIVAGYPEDIGEGGGVGGIAPFTCNGVWENSINFTFAASLGGNAQVLCEVIAQESGHVMGLEHAYLCEDPMTYLDGCGPKTFQDIDAECGELSVRPCECGNATQNSVQHLLGLFGPGNIPATANIEITGVREDPGSSDGNAITEPGENLLIELAVTNEGNFTSEEVKFSIKSGGHLKLLTPSASVVLEPRQTQNIQLLAEVNASACARDVEFEVVTELASGKWSASSNITTGIEGASWTSKIEEDEAWTADDGSDAPQGAWEYGVPEQTIFAGRVMQPSGSGEGPNRPVWMTGLGGAWDESSLVGTSTLETSTIDVDGWYVVSGIQYRLWHLAYDRSSGGLDLSPEAHLRVELSKNNGKSWTEIDAVIGQDYRWDMREVTFDPIEVSSKVKLRFTVSNEGTVDDRLIEIGIDSVTLQGGELLCTPTTGGCGCSASDSQGLGALLWLVPLWLFFRRRRSQVAA
jgi:MYXO-CTERM domain-containing protein